MSQCTASSNLAATWSARAGEDLAAMDSEAIACIYLAQLSVAARWRRSRCAEPPEQLTNAGILTTAEGAR
jgi:hypothetical protein